jgi:hypothetical protein
VPSPGVGQVAPRRHQLVVVALDEILPRELGVARLGGGGGQVEAQRVGVVLAQEVGHIDERAAALAELGPLEVQVFNDCA